MPEPEAREEAGDERAALAAAAHDLRTPLDALTALTEALGSEALSPEGRDRLRVLAATILHLRAVATTILDEGRLAAGQTLDPAVPFSPAALLSDIAALSSARAAHDRKAFGARIGPMPASAHGHPVMLRRALENLLDNAFKIAGRIDLSASLADGNLRIVVADNGPGYANKDGASAFPRFAPSGGIAGSGLGLWLTRRIAERLGGSLTVESQKGAGSRFALSIPLAPSPEEAAQTAELPADSPSLRVLVVDDNAFGRRVARAMLEALGQRVLEADGMAAALEVLRRARCDVVLMDIQMPDGDGYRTLASIRALGGTGAGPKVIAMSAAGEVARADVLAAGFDDFMAKPIDPAQLANSIGFVVQQ